MGTRSRIGLKIDGGIVSAYHHWDGYPEWLGVTLEKKFNTRETVEELIDGGDMSCCDSDSDWDLKKCEPHVQYYSLRGEDCPPKMSESLTEYLDLAEKTDGEYAYVFDGTWTCYEVGQYHGVKGRILDIPANYPVHEPVT
tara:strand:+ start:78 stop:497 length:420 start_codon:yes stop_codon:yes gene_type:complete